jgi:hypothetical protein
MAVILVGLASIETCFAMSFRLEGSDELKMIERVDFELGGIFALAFLLFFAPSHIRAPKAWLFALLGATSLWLGVSGSLIYSHREQHRIRSG